MSTLWTSSMWCSFLFDGDWLELRICPVNAINRTAYGHTHRARWLTFVPATVELLKLSRSHWHATGSFFLFDCQKKSDDGTRTMSAHANVNPHLRAATMSSGTSWPKVARLRHASRGFGHWRFQRPLLPVKVGAWRAAGISPCTHPRSPA